MPFAGLEPPVPGSTGFIQMRAAASTSTEYDADSSRRIPAQIYTIPSWRDGTARTDIALPVLTTRRRNCVCRESEKHRPTGPRKKSDDHSRGELRESKTKWLDQMRHVLHLKHMRSSTEKAYVQFALYPEWVSVGAGHAQCHYQNLRPPENAALRSCLARTTG